MLSPLLSSNPDRRRSLHQVALLQDRLRRPDYATGGPAPIGPPSIRLRSEKSISTLSFAQGDLLRIRSISCSDQAADFFLFPGIGGSKSRIRHTEKTHSGQSQAESVW